jgi:hypothetical protein
VARIDGIGPRARRANSSTLANIESSLADWCDSFVPEALARYSVALASAKDWLTRTDNADAVMVSLRPTS